MYVYFSIQIIQIFNSSLFLGVWTWLDFQFPKGKISDIMFNDKY